MSSCCGGSGCAGRGAGRAGRSAAAACGLDLAARAAASSPSRLVPAHRAPGARVSRTQLQKQHQWGVHPAVPGRAAVGWAEPCLSKTSQQTKLAGSVLSQGSVMEWAAVILAHRRRMASAEPGSPSRDQQLPWRSCRKRWLALAGPGLRRLPASSGRRTAGSSAAGGGGACGARPGIRQWLLRVVLGARASVF